MSSQVPSTNEIPTHSKEIPKRFQWDSKEIPMRFQRDSKEIATRFQKDSNEIPTRFQRDSNEIPKRFHWDPNEIPKKVKYGSNETPVTPQKEKEKPKVLRWPSDNNQQTLVTQWSWQPPGPEWDSRWAARPLQGPRPRTTVNCNYSWLSAGGFELALASIKYLEEGCHASCTHHFLWNRQDQPVVGMSKLL